MVRYDTTADSALLRVNCFTTCTEQWRLGRSPQSPAVIDAGEPLRAGRLASRVAGVGLLLAAFGLMALLCLIWGDGW